MLLYGRRDVCHAVIEKRSNGENEENGKDSFVFSDFFVAFVAPFFDLVASRK
jgi:hypothetical protein